jgi:glycosyltransferase involved in cell wall biosynthesis
MISVVTPVLNESPTVASLVSFSRRAPGVTEVIVVDDGSIDGTPELAAQAGVRVVTSTLLGKGASMEDGLSAPSAATQASLLWSYSMNADNESNSSDTGDSKLCFVIVLAPRIGAPILGILAKLLGLVRRVRCVSRSAHGVLSWRIECLKLVSRLIGLFARRQLPINFILKP